MTASFPIQLAELFSFTSQLHTTRDLSCSRHQNMPIPMNDINSPTVTPQVSDHAPNLETMSMQQLSEEKDRLEEELNELFNVLKIVRKPIMCALSETVF